MMEELYAKTRIEMTPSGVSLYVRTLKIILDNEGMAHPRRQATEMANNNKCYNTV
jgi:hypothetical protein